MTPLRQRFVDDLRLRNLSPRTIACYVAHVAAFARHFGRSPDQLDQEHIRLYQLHLRDEKQASWSLFNQAVCALRFFYKVTLPSPWAVEHLPYAKRPRSLPAVLSREEVQQLLVCVERPIYRLLLSLRSKRLRRFLLPGRSRHPAARIAGKESGCWWSRRLVPHAGSCAAACNCGTPHEARGRSTFRAVFRRWCSAARQPHFARRTTGAFVPAWAR
jgi:integrase